MDENLNNENNKEIGKKVDLSKIHNKMFDENPDTFTEAEFMNRDYLNHIYGEDMDFLNKEIRQSRIKHYQEKQELEDNTAFKIKEEKKRMGIYSAVFLVALSPIIAVIIRVVVTLIRYTKLMGVDMWGAMSNANMQAHLVSGGFFISATWMFFVIIVTIYGVAIFSSVKKIKLWKYGLENALKRLEDSKEEYMLEGLYDAE